MIVDKINAFLTSGGKTVPVDITTNFSIACAQGFNRQFGPEEEQKKTLRLSSLGDCIRKNAYKLRGEPVNGKTIDSRAKVVFLMGDLTEAAVINLAKLAGCEILDQQKEVSMFGVKGHIDGMLVLPDKNRLVEVKSMSSFAFERFEKSGEISEAYIWQYNLYMAALGLNECVYVALNKDAGVLAERIFRLDQSIVDRAGLTVRALASLGENLPPKPFKPDEKGFLPWNCRFCSFFSTCWPESKLVLVGKSYKLRVENEKV